MSASVDSETKGGARRRREAGKSSLIVLVIVAVVSAALGAGITFMFPGHKPHAEEVKPPKKEPTRKVLSENLDLTFNPVDKQRSRIAKMTLAFEILAENAEEAEKLALGRKEIVRSSLLIYLSDFKVEQLLGTENLILLQKELRKRCEPLLFPKNEAQLSAVFITETMVN